MKDDEITALAKSVAPFVRECVSEAIGKTMVVSPEVAAQVAEAVRLLHESPPAECSKAPLLPSLPRLTRIERDAQGNFVPVYGTPA